MLIFQRIFDKSDERNGYCAACQFPNSQGAQRGGEQLSLRDVGRRAETQEPAQTGRTLLPAHRL